MESTQRFIGIKDEPTAPASFVNGEMIATQEQEPAKLSEKEVLERDVANALQHIGGLLDDADEALLQGKFFYNDDVENFRKTVSDAQALLAGAGEKFSTITLPAQYPTVQDASREIADRLARTERQNILVRFDSLLDSVVRMNRANNNMNESNLNLFGQYVTDLIKFAKTCKDIVPTETAIATLRIEIDRAKEKADTLYQQLQSDFEHAHYYGNEIEANYRIQKMLLNAVDVLA